MSAFSVAAFTLAWWISAAAFGRFVVVVIDSGLSRYTRHIFLIFALLAAGIHYAAAFELYPILFPMEGV